MDPVLLEIETRLEVSFRDQKHLKQALTHRSFAQSEDHDLLLEDNERLEFLGDSVLYLAVTDLLFKRFPSHSEGKLTDYRSALTNKRFLSVRAEEIGLQDHLLYLSDHTSTPSRERLMCDALEALIGAIFVDQGYSAAAEFITKHILVRMDEVIAEDHLWNAKGKLDTEARKRLKIVPRYRVLKEEGRIHEKQFTVGVYFGNNLIARGCGSHKRFAEDDAARNALCLKGWVSPASSAG